MQHTWCWSGLDAAVQGVVSALHCETWHDDTGSLPFATGFVAGVVNAGATLIAPSVHNHAEQITAIGG
jgi:hypothetical protein